MNGTVERRNVAITLLDDSRTPVLRWLLRECLDREVRGARAATPSENEVAIETIELAHEGLELVT